MRTISFQHGVRVRREGDATRCVRRRADGEERARRVARDLGLAGGSVLAVKR